MTARLLTEAAAPQEMATIESDFVVILASLLCGITCIIGLFAVFRCTCCRPRTAAPNPPNKGLKKKVLKSLPIYTFGADSPTSAVSAAATECAICLADYAIGDEIRVLPQCGHGFHALCVDTWLKSHSSCPSCRQIFVPVWCKKCGESPMGSV